MTVKTQQYCINKAISNTVLDVILSRLANNHIIMTRQAVVKVVMCSGGGAQPLRSRRTKISIQCCTQKLHIKLTAYFTLAFKSRFMMKLHKKLPVENGSKLGDVCNNFYRSTNC